MNRTKGRLLNAVLIILSAGLLASAVTLAVLYRAAAASLVSAAEEREAMSLRLSELNTELSGLGDEIEALESEKKAAESEAYEKALKIDGLESMIELLEDAQKGMTETNGQLSARLKEANRMADSLRSDVDALTKKIGLQTEKVNALRARSDELKTTVSELEEQLRGANEEIRAWEEAAAPLASPMGQERGEVLSLEIPENPEPADPDDAPVRQEPEQPEMQPDPEPPAEEPLPEPVEENPPEPPEPSTEPGTPPENDLPEPLGPEPGPAEHFDSEPDPEPPPEPLPPPPPVTESTMGETEPVNVLMRYMQNGAPLRWDWISGTNRLTEIYPKLSYYYEDLTTGDTVSYNPDVITYAASLIKVPYLYSVLLEIEAFEAAHEKDADGKIVYGPGEEKYDLDEVWVYDPETMYEEGSGEIMEMEAGISMPVRQLFEYAILYSDNIAWMQIYDRFGYESFYRLMEQLGVQGTEVDFMDLTARDCGKIMKDVYRYFALGSEYALWMQNLMSRSKYGHLIADHYPGILVCHKYGWDTESYHDMALVYDEHPYILVIMTDYEDGGATAAQYFSDVVSMTKVIHATNH
ncbi:MAG: hypothetical protein E7576_10945 [Ruminococcaceae bacterium]|jgi:outer membrane murein-binding lipoprotein Lpp|nr:hypothetical protein [Oscillospiraceae bacterium]